MNNRSNQGFTIVELLVVTILIAVTIVLTSFLISDSFTKFMRLQVEGIEFGRVSMNTQRVAQVIRGATELVSADGTDLRLNSYFSPNDNVQSQIHYYTVKNPDNKFYTLKAEVTPYDVNPPIGTLQTNNTREYTITERYLANPIPLFRYFSATDTEYTTVPLTNPSTVKAIQVTIIDPSMSNQTSTSTIKVTMRNKKTNL